MSFSFEESAYVKAELSNVLNLYEALSKLIKPEKNITIYKNATTQLRKNGFKIIDEDFTLEDMANSILAEPTHCLSLKLNFVAVVQQFTIAILTMLGKDVDIVAATISNDKDMKWSTWMKEPYAEFTEKCNEACANKIYDEEIKRMLDNWEKDLLGKWLQVINLLLTSY